MIYTCYEMIADCQAGRPQGWLYFIANYVPALRQFLAHYYPAHAGDEPLVQRVAVTLCRPESVLFQSAGPAPERAFVAALRQHALAAVESVDAAAAPEVAIDLESLAPALEPLTLTEKQVAWFETMRYPPPIIGRMLRMSAETAENIRARTADLVRAHLDSWRATILADNGAALGLAAAAQSTADCVPPKTFFDVIDGRATWRGREEMERHVKGCFHCIDHFCRLLEVVDVLRAAKPLSQAEAEPYQRLLGVAPPKRSFWKR
jgi:hypothetical protein